MEIINKYRKVVEKNQYNDSQQKINYTDYQ
jgi:hypothetical protein